MLGKAEGLHLTQLILEQCNFMEMLFLRKCRAPLLYPKFHFDQVNIFDNTQVHYFNRSSRLWITTFQSLNEEKFSSMHFLFLIINHLAELVLVTLVFCI